MIWCIQLDLKWGGKREAENWHWPCGRNALFFFPDGLNLKGRTDERNLHLMVLPFTKARPWFESPCIYLVSLTLLFVSRCVLKSCLATRFGDVTFRFNYRISLLIRFRVSFGFRHIICFGVNALPLAFFVSIRGEKMHCALILSGCACIIRLRFFMRIISVIGAGLLWLYFMPVISGESWS